MEDAVSVSGNNGRIVVAGAGYAGLHVALRLMVKLHNKATMELTLVDQHDYHEVITELPRVAAGTRAADAVRIPFQDMLDKGVRFIQTKIIGFDLPDQRLLTEGGTIGWQWLVLALGSRPNDFAIPGLAQRSLSWRRDRGRAGRRAGRDAARGGSRPRSGARAAGRGACRGGSHHPGRLLTQADR
jgi:NADPH-dependent 2,4-dienoyl-CoA reductase/sulfur reductase-like enzyme